MTCEDAPASPGMARSIAGSARVSHTIFATLREWRRRMHDRAQLGALSDSMLRDIGISPAEATYLSSKPFWKE